LVLRQKSKEFAAHPSARFFGVSVILCDENALASLASWRANTAMSITQKYDQVLPELTELDLQIRE